MKNRLLAIGTDVRRNKMLSIRINNCSFIRHSVCLRVCVGVNTVCDLCGSFWLHAGRCGALRSEDGWSCVKDCKSVTAVRMTLNYVPFGLHSRTTAF